MEHKDLHWKQLKPNPLNRLVRGEDIDPAALQGLADSIMENGLVEPLLVVPNGDGYEILSGERRWRAAKLLGDDAPLLACQIRAPMAELEQLVLMGVENLQRQDLSPMAEARYFEALRQRGLSVQQITRRTGVRVSYVRERLHLLELAPAVQDLVQCGAIPISAHKCLRRLAPDDQVQLARKMRGRSLAAIKRAVDVVLKRRERQAAAAIAGSARSGGALPAKPPPETISHGELELATRATCAACEVHAGLQHDLPWEHVGRALEGQCQSCEVQDLEEACRLCPLVDFLRALGTLVRDRGQAVGPAHLYQKEIL